MSETLIRNHVAKVFFGWRNKDGVEAELECSYLLGFFDGLILTFADRDERTLRQISKITEYVEAKNE